MYEKKNRFTVHWSDCVLRMLDPDPFLRLKKPDQTGSTTPLQSKMNPSQIFSCQAVVPHGMWTVEGSVTKH